MSDFKNILLKIIFAVIVPIVGIPLYDVGYDQMNDSFGSGDNSWAVSVYSIMFILVFALVPIGLLYVVFKDMNQ